MKKSDELKMAINAKRAEVEKLQQEENITAAKNAASELNKLVDEYDIAVTKERADFENFLAKPKVQVGGAIGAVVSKNNAVDNLATLRNRAFNKLVLNRGQLTDEERQAYFNVSGSPGQPAQIESIDEKGGYLVPEEQLTQIREFRKAYAALRDYCHVVHANSTTGKYPTLGEESGLLVNFDEMTDIKESDFEFGQAKYEIADYGDIIPVSNQLIADANVNILSIVGQRLARKAVNTENALILGKLNALTATTISDLKGLNKALISDLDPVYWSNARIYTNQDGFLWLSNLVDSTQRPMLQPDVTAPDVYRYKGKPIVVLPNSTLPNGTNSIPFFVGNLADYLMFFERQGVEIAVSKEVFFTKYGTALRCVVRFGVAVDDKDAVVALNVATT